MLELRGKYSSCKIFIDTVDSSTQGQLFALMNQESVKDSIIRIMPDCNAAKASVVGTTMTVKDKVIPNIVSGDIGCGILCVELSDTRVDLPKFDSVVNKCIPSGAQVHKESRENKTSIQISDIRCYKSIAKKEDYCYRSIGTLGGGNHFISLEREADSNLTYLLIHSGSRYLGQLVCDFYQKAAYEQCKKSGIDVPFELACVSGSLFDDYIHDLKIVQQFAADNRAEMARIIIKQAKLHELGRFDTIHNYIDTQNMILRKGSVSARNGETLVIPLNMRDGSLICVGKGNEDWNFSAPHGAGRLMSRADAKQSIGMTEFKESMKGIYSTSVSKSTLDESPMAYKPMEIIIDNIGDTVDIIKHIKPIYNFKASGKE